jgi:hypothetical protein
MTLKFLLAACLLLLSSCSTVSTRTENGLFEKDSIVTRSVAEGVVHRHIVSKDGPWNIHVVAIDLSKQELDIESGRAFDSTKGRETTSSIARRKSSEAATVLAAVNADFFNMTTGENDLSQVIDGEIAKGVKGPSRALFAFDYSRRPHIDKFVFDGFAITQRTQFPIGAVNALADSMVLLNHFVGSYLTKEAESVLSFKRVRRNGDTLVAVMIRRLAVGEQTNIGDSILLVRAIGTKRRFLEEIATNDTIRFVLGFLPKTERIKSLVGGLPRIVVDGRNIAATDSLNGLSAKFVETKHPRTGVGFSKDGRTIFLIAVDGRQASSVGMSLIEFADCMIRAGCFQGLNLDGGGSTTMVVEGNVVNSPSDSKGERPVANVLLVVKKK